MFNSISDGYLINTSEPGNSFRCKAEEFLLLAMIKSGKKTMSVGCRSGGCGACKILILQGEYATGKMSRVHISEKEEKQGYVLACRCNPRSDLVVKVVGTMQSHT